MKIAVLSSFTTSLFWFRLDMMQSFKAAGYEVLAVGDGDEAEWGRKFADLGIRYRSIPVQRTGTNPVRDMKTLAALCRLLNEEKPDKIFAYQAKTVIYGGIAASLNGIREFYPMIAGVGSVFLGDSPKQKLIRRILVAEYKLGMRKAPKIFFQNRDDLKVFTDAGILPELGIREPLYVTALKYAGVTVTEERSAGRMQTLKLEQVRDFEIDGATHSVIVLRKVQPTPPRFPRRFSKIKQTPL